MPVARVLDAIREAATSEADKGQRFERLIQSALRLDRTYRDRFTEVWRWMEWPDRGNEPDVGIDLVARNRDGGYTAIQCKFFAPDSQLDKSDIDSFFTASGRDPFTDRIIVATTDLWSRHAESAIAHQQIPVTRIGVDDLDAMTVDWDQFDATNLTGLAERPRLRLRPHQVAGVEKVRAGFGEADRGKLIMACGTGKTFAALRIAEENAGPGKAVLFLAPSIALVSQALKEWTAESEVPIRPFAVCSDATAGKALEGENAAHYDLAIPATTDTRALLDAGMGDLVDDQMTVVFSTYQSIQVVADAQASTGLIFDLVICDEAHRTTGVMSTTEDASAFLKVHDNTVIPARKRLYMTATPRIYQAAAKEEATEQDLLLASMDDADTYGSEFYRLGFGEAVELGLLADYKVLILTVQEEAVSRAFQHLLSNEGELRLPDVAKFIGCHRALAKLPSANQRGGFTGTEPPMRRAVAFWSTIKESERFASMFELVSDHHNRQLAAAAGTQGDGDRQLRVPTRHVDGTTNIRSRRRDVRWLKEEPPEGECRVLTNARCLTEGVDIPSLDAVMFLKPKRSKIDIVQAVGRVMRKPEGKNLGYIILPIAIPAGTDPAEALKKNKDYDVVWDVLQALRSHDERFNAYINRLALRDDPEPDDDDPIVVIDGTPTDPGTEQPEADAEADETGVQSALFTFEEWTGAIYTKIVKKVGTRTYWEDWARDVADIAERHIVRINDILAADPEVARAFERFIDGLRANLNDSITQDDAISMLSQHLVTRPIFETLFGSDSFVASNPVSQAMQDMVDLLDDHNLDTESESLEDFYNSVRRRVDGIPADDAESRQRIIKDLYGNFFSIAFPKVAEGLGIVYTPIEVVDFMLRATEAALREHFDGASLTDDGVHILDPFSGTGTFITRLLQSGLIEPHDLARKYTEEIHTNEILLLAYYIAAVNIENTYRQELTRLAIEHDPGLFPGIVLTDTFRLGESGEGSGSFDVFPVNNARAERQRGLDIRVIISNPPYSGGQRSVNDANPNVAYPGLDSAIAGTYAARSTAINKNSLYDSYIRAIRWASDRILGSDHGGIITYVTNGGYIAGNAADGLRLTLVDEFHHIYIYNLRGNARTAGEKRRRESGNVFGGGSKASIAIMLLVKQPGPVQPGGARIHYRDIGDYLSRDDKLRRLQGDLPDPQQADTLNTVGWTRITPNEHGDWINQRSAEFSGLIPLHSPDEDSIFRLRTNGLQTNRDAWNYSSSRQRLVKNTERMIAAFNHEVDRFHREHTNLPKTTKARAALARKFVHLDPAKFSWDRSDFARVGKGERFAIDDAQFTQGLYRPFHKRHVNVARVMNKEVSQLPRVFPPGADNLAICVSTKGARAPFSALITRWLPDVHMWIDDTPCLPLYVYDGVPNSSSHRQPSLMAVGDGRVHNVTQEAVSTFQPIDSDIAPDDVFFYVYGVLHSSEYRDRFRDDLSKSLPRVPVPGKRDVFWGFSESGRELARLHTEYEEVEPWKALEVVYGPGFDEGSTEAFRVKKMRYPKIKDPDDPVGRKIDDKTTIIYNKHITIRGVPERAHDYRLGARSAIDWVLESYQVKTHKASGIVNDPNDWAIEHGTPSYILDLIGSVVTVSMRTLDIVDSLPPLDLDGA